MQEEGAVLVDSAQAQVYLLLRGRITRLLLEVVATLPQKAMTLYLAPLLRPEVGRAGATMETLVLAAAREVVVVLVRPVVAQAVQETRQRLLQMVGMAHLRLRAKGILAGMGQISLP